ncbi:MAG: TetR/AcrR family transcriptional regulator [Synechococcales cyanobacterium RM1_1_8]|nr:TetR/AcrR family transcriptional regulator [Synechococcales cyanobacterium RM1_1_8]
MASPLKSQQILNGARQEFLAKGFAATTVDSIAATAGVSKATIYSYFKGKEDLFRALIEGFAQQRLQMFEGFKKQDADPRAVLRNIALLSLTKAAEDESFQALQRMLIGESHRFPEISKILWKP